MRPPDKEKGKNPGGQGNRMEDSLLIFDQVCAGYGRLSVLNNLSFQVRRGQVLGIIGPNGCGKSTMLNVLGGYIPVTKGEIHFDGTSLNRLPVYRRSRLGIGRTFQVPKPFERMSVYENVLVSAVFGSGISQKEGREPALEMLDMVGLTEKRDILAGELNLLNRKRLEIARAVVSRPKLLLLDEPAAGLSGPEVQQIMKLVRRLKNAGFTIVWIEHIIETMTLATDVLMCMSQGRNAVWGDPKEVIRSSQVETLYLGQRWRGVGYAET